MNRTDEAQHEFERLLFDAQTALGAAAEVVEQALAAHLADYKLMSESAQEETHPSRCDFCEGVLAAGWKADIATKQVRSALAVLMAVAH